MRHRIRPARIERSVIAVVGAAVLGCTQAADPSSSPADPTPLVDRARFARGLQFLVSAREATMEQDVQVLTGNVRVKVIDRSSRVLAVLRADRAERREGSITVTGRVEGSLTRAGAGILPTSLVGNAPEAVMGERVAVLRASRATVSLALDELELTDVVLNVEPPPTGDGDDPDFPPMKLEARTVRMVGADDGRYRLDYSGPRISVVFDDGAD